MKNKTKKTLWEESGGLQLDKKRAGVDSTGPRAWRGPTGQHAPTAASVSAPGRAGPSSDPSETNIASGPSVLT